VGVPGCYPGRGRFESFPRRSDSLVLCSHAPGVSVGVLPSVSRQGSEVERSESSGEGRQLFKLEVGGSIPLGSTRGLAVTAPPCVV
jgi:hypothetical protein